MALLVPDMPAPTAIPRKMAAFPAIAPNMAASNLTPTEDTALRAFLNTLQDADMLDDVVEFWPMFLNNEADSRIGSCARRAGQQEP